MDFISDVLADVDDELLTARTHQILRLEIREWEVERKKEAEEKKNAYIKRKNAVEVNKGNRRKKTP